MTKFRLIVYYAGEDAYKYLVEIAETYNLSYTHIADRCAIIFFINDVDMLVTVSKDIQSAVI